MTNMDYKNTQEKTAQALWGLIIAIILLFVFFAGLGYLAFNGVEGEDLVANQ